MSEELIQRDLLVNVQKVGEWNYYNIGNTSLSALKKAKIIPNKNYGTFESKKPDALLTDGKNVLVVVEYKDPSELKTDRLIKKAIDQEIGVAKILDSKIYIVTDGCSRTFWINPLTGGFIQDAEGNNLNQSFKPGVDSESLVKLISPILSSITDVNDRLLSPRVIDPLPLAKQVWQDLWSVSGATPENCLYTFVEIFIYKYLSDLRVLTGMSSFDHLRSLYSTDSEERVLEYYANNVRMRIKELFPGNPLDHTTIINGTIFVSKDDKAVRGYSATFRKILDRFADFGTLENIDYDFKSKLFETFLKESISKKNWGQYFTPLRVVRSIVSMADIHRDMSLCDPACGVGKFLLEPILTNLSQYYEIKDNKIIPHIKLIGFDKGFDRDEQKTIILAKANMLIYMSSLIQSNRTMTEQFAELFNQSFVLQTNSILGTLSHPHRDLYDLILTNPPYVVEGSSNLKDEINKDPELKQYYSISSMGIEGLFMQWIINALKPGGKAFIVVPDGLMNRAHDAQLRKHILDTCVLDGVISLPIDTFFTTNKKTFIMIVTKKIPSQRYGYSEYETQTDSVFTYLCSEIGETRDVRRYPIEQNDLREAANLYNMFKGNKNHFKTSDPRCKIVPIQKFYDSETWSVDQWWTYDEKVSMGISESSDIVPLSDYVGLIDDVSNSLKDYCEPMSELTSDIHCQYREFKLLDLMEPVKGKSIYTKGYGEQHRGPYPVYSASNDKVLTHIDSFDYDGRYLSWATNGFAGTLKVIEGKFSVNGDRGLLVPREGVSLDIEYLRFTLEPIFRNMAKGRRGDNGEDEFTKLYPTMLKNISVNIPVNTDGLPDLQMQQTIANRYLSLEKFKNEMQEMFNKLSKTNVKMI